MDDTVEYDIRDDDIHHELHSESSAPLEGDQTPMDFVDIENPSTAVVEMPPQQSFLDKINHDLHRFKHAVMTPTMNIPFSLIPQFDATRKKLEHMYIESNSPISSGHNSEYEDSDVSERTAPFQLIHEEVDNVFAHKKINYRKITYDEIERSLSKYYDKNNKFSNEMDILITYTRGQKYIYNQSSYITQMKLYAITIAALCITSFITVITPFIQDTSWRIIIVSGGNAIATILITVLNYLRFESAYNSYTLMANHYERFEHSLEFTNNKLTFMNNEAEQNKLVLEKIKEIEFKMAETKELCPILIPEEVKQTFPVICHTNIFSLIKKMDTHRKTLILQFKDIKNEIRYILYKWNSLPIDVADESTQRMREKTRLLFLMELKEKIKKELIDYKDVYNQVDDLFMKEIKYSEVNRGILRVLCCQRKTIQYHTYTNAVIREHLDIIFS
jgi:hypothetical protein